MMSALCNWEIWPEVGGERGGFLAERWFGEADPRIGWFSTCAEMDKAGRRR